MKAKTKKQIMQALVLVGGLVHLAAPLGVDILGMIPYSNIVQGVAGAATLLYISK